MGGASVSMLKALMEALCVGTMRAEAAIGAHCLDCAEHTELGKLQRQMNDLRGPFQARLEAELSEHFQHCGVLGQHLRD